MRKKSFLSRKDEKVIAFEGFSQNLSQKWKNRPTADFIDWMIYQSRYLTKTIQPSLSLYTVENDYYQGTHYLYSAALLIGAKWHCNLINFGPVL